MVDVFLTKIIFKKKIFEKSIFEKMKKTFEK